MRVNEVFASALYTSAILLCSARAADDIDDAAEASSASLSESSTSVPIEKPTFTVRNPGISEPFVIMRHTIGGASLCAN